MIEMVATLTALAADRPVFHSEADFQHALAWQIHLRYPDARLRLEYRSLAGASIYLDLWIAEEDHATAVELKYPTRLLDVTYANEQFALRNQSALDIRRYDIVADVARLERIVANLSSVTGYAIVLTNDSALWSPIRKQDSMDAAFRIHEGIHLHGSLAWAQWTNASVCSP